MGNENILIHLSELYEVDFLSFNFEGVRHEGMDGIKSIVKCFIQSFPYRQVSQVKYQKKQRPPSSAAEVEVLNIQASNFEFQYGNWFICSEYPLELTFEEHNRLMGYGARIPSSNWRGEFARWAAKVLQSTKANCIGIMDVDDSYLTVCFWPVELRVIESHLEPLLNKRGLKISKGSF